MAQIRAYGGQIDLAFEWLDQAYEVRGRTIVLLKRSPLLRNPHGDSRWPAFLKKMKFPDDPAK